MAKFITLKILLTGNAVNFTSNPLKGMLSLLLLSTKSIRSLLPV